jgi:hypothetical protein
MRSLLSYVLSVSLRESRNAHPDQRALLNARLVCLALAVLFAALCPGYGTQPAIEAATVPNNEASAQPWAAAEADPQTAQPHEMIYIHIGPESPEDHRYSYHWQVLQQALDKTSPKYGTYRIEPAEFMSEERQVFELLHQSGKLTVILRGDTQEYAKAFEWVRIPIDKGLLGYRVFLIRREDQPRLTHETTLDDLRNFTIGQGNGWKDIEILRANRMKVMAGGDYAGLFAMLANRRFDLFSRGVEEVLDEYSQHRQQFPSIAIEENLILYYPIARYFWFSRSDQGRELAQRVREGMMMMIEDGSFDRLFDAAHKDVFDNLHLADRRLFVLQNPLATPEPLIDDSRYWYMPLKREGSSPTKPLSSP